jgi:orotate phosphoribosyltransferase
MKRKPLTGEKHDIAIRAARMMLEIKTFQFNATKPYIFTSGWASPVYVDCRKIISFPRLRAGLMEYGARTVLNEVGYESVDVIAGGETAGIPFAAWMADRLSLPMQYVRKKAKGFGRNAQIEGEVVAGARTLLVEDLTTDGRSKVNFCEALRKAGVTVDHCFVLFYYDIFPESADLFKDLGVELHYLTTFWEVLEAAEKSGDFDKGVLREVEAFLNEPAKWSAAHGGISSIGEKPAAA